MQIYFAAKMLYVEIKWVEKYFIKYLIVRRMKRAYSLSLSLL